MIEVPEVIEAAEELDAKIAKPGPYEKSSDWDSLAHRLDDTMRNRLIEFAKQVR